MRRGRRPTCSGCGSGGKPAAAYEGGDSSPQHSRSS